MFPWESKAPLGSHSPLPRPPGLLCPTALLAASPVLLVHLLPEESGPREISVLSCCVEGTGCSKATAWRQDPTAGQEGPAGPWRADCRRPVRDACSGSRGSPSWPHLSAGARHHLWPRIGLRSWEKFCWVEGLGLGLVRSCPGHAVPPGCRCPSRPSLPRWLPTIACQCCEEGAGRPTAAHDPDAFVPGGAQHRGPVPETDWTGAA